MKEQQRTTHKSNVVQLKCYKL